MKQLTDKITLFNLLVSRLNIFCTLVAVFDPLATTNGRFKSSSGQWDVCAIRHQLVKNNLLSTQNFRF